MRTSRAKLTAALSILAISAPAIAQRAGPYMPSLGAPSAEIRGESRDDVREAMRQFGLCVATREKARATAFINLRLDAQDYHSRIAKLAVPECLSGGGLKFQSTSFRGNLFAAFYNLRFKEGPPGNLSDFAGRYKAQYVEALPDRARNVLALELFGECVTLKDPAMVHALLRSLPGSADETARFQSLSPHFSGCIPVGETLAFSKTILRGALAEGIYWMSAAAETASGPQGGR